MSFAAPPGSAWDHGAIPSAAAPNRSNLALYPFWDDLLVDSSASIRTIVTGTAPNRQFVVEWRNLRTYDDPNVRVDFEVIFNEGSGAITFTYNNIANVPREQGGQATVGIENLDGTIALQFSLNQPRAAHRCQHYVPAADVTRGGGGATGGEATGGKATGAWPPSRLAPGHATMTP
jgi:hypothetical protein